MDVIKNSLTIYFTKNDEIGPESLIPKYLVLIQDLLTSLKISFESEAFFHALELLHQLNNRLTWVCKQSLLATTRELITSVIPGLIRCLEQEIYYQTSQETDLKIKNNYQLHPWEGDFVSKPYALDKDLFYFGKSKFKENLLVTS